MNNKAVKIGDKLVTASDPTIIELEVQGTCFPDRLSIVSNFLILGSGSNELQVDWNDGTPVETFVFTNNFGSANTILHYFQNLANPAKIGTIDQNYTERRRIKFKFKFPNRIVGIGFQNQNLYGQFPVNIGNYNLTNVLSFAKVKFFDNFPVNFRGLSTNSLRLSDITQTTITSIPEWIYNSRIKILWLNIGFNLNQIPSISNTDKLINTIGLEDLRLSGLSSDSIPNNWKDISTLRILRVGTATFTELPNNISLISQLTTLVLSANDGNGTVANFTSWGNGLGLMANLNTLTYVWCSGNLLTTDLPLGIENCQKLKNINAGGSFISIARTDTHITNWYNMVIANGDIISTVNNNFRDINFLIYFDTATSFRPTGTYQQPAGFVLGSNNGTPASVMEMIWVLVTQYKWKVTVMNVSGTGSEILQ